MGGSDWLTRLVTSIPYIVPLDAFSQCGLGPEDGIDAANHFHILVWPLPRRVQDLWLSVFYKEHTTGTNCQPRSEPPEIAFVSPPIPLVHTGRLAARLGLQPIMSGASETPD